jgi:hypothetical protein
MLRLVAIVTVLMLAGGCAAVKQNVSDPIELITVVPSITPSFILGDRVYNAEMAKDIAEYILAKEGVDCRNLTVQVSFCDGIYTVAFCEGKGSDSSSFSVDIDANNSKILAVKKTRTKIAAAL